jgi:hypothetical protein
MLFRNYETVHSKVINEERQKCENNFSKKAAD